jgi:hypothetical protein
VSNVNLYMTRRETLEKERGAKIWIGYFFRQLEETAQIQLAGRGGF